MLIAAEKIDKVIQELDHRFDFDALVADVVEDTIAYGEYSLRTKVKSSNVDTKDDQPKKDSIDKVGLLDVIDDVDQEKVIAITKAGKIESYLVMDRNKLVLKEPADYIRFSIGYRKIRIDLQKEFQNQR